MRAPGFWYPERDQTSGLAPYLLSPFAFLYSSVGWLKRQVTAPERMSVPVICIGNFTAGGAGKTPTAIAVVERLISLGETPHFLSRGYGGTEVGPIQVDAAHHKGSDVGDEPLLLSAHAPTWISRDRVAGGLAAERAGASVIVMDDGFQNPSVFKDLSLLVVDSKVGIGNRRVIPSGPLREPMADALARTDAVIALGERAGLSFLPEGMPVFHATLEPAHTGADNLLARLKGARCFAFAGIGRPSKFFDTLRTLGAELAGTRAFDDHHPYSDTDVRGLITDAATHGARLITTEKDAVRLKELPNWAEFSSSLDILPVRAIFPEVAALDALLAAGLDKARAHYTYAPPGSDQGRTRVR
ncbi:MAG: tetraacyldisaccharide 4'-kinase [Parvibaculum sp.]